MGEIGLPIFKLLSKNMLVDGLDKIEKLNSEKFIDIKKIELMHICIPFTKSFQKNVIQLSFIVPLALILQKNYRINLICQ